MDADHPNRPNRRSRVLGAWPHLLNLDEACDYLGMSPGTFRKVCPVPPVAIGAAMRRWNRTQLEVWANALPPKYAGRVDQAPSITPPYDVATEASDARRQEALRKTRERTRGRSQTP